MEKTVILAFAFPAVAVVTIVRGDDHDSALVIVNGANVHVLCSLRKVVIMIVFPGDAKPAAVWIEAIDALPAVRRLQLVHGDLNIEHAMEDLIGHLQINEITVRERTFDITSEVVPLFLSPEIVGP